MHRPRDLAFLLVVLFAAGSADAAPPSYDTFQLQARSNFSGAFNLPDSAFFANATPQISDGGRMVLRLDVLPGAGDGQGVWAGEDGAGSVVYSNQAGEAVSGPTVNGGGRIAFEQLFSAQDGLYFHDLSSGTSGLLTNLPLGADGWGSPRINDAGEVGYRAAFSGDHAYASWSPTLGVAIHAAEVTLDVGSPYSFLFTPSFNGQRRIAAKVRLGGPGEVGESQPDEIRIFAADGGSVRVAEDTDSDSLSPYQRFDNSVSLTEDGKVAFVATLAGGVRAVFLHDGAQVIEIASEVDAEIGEIEFFAPAANAAGLVAFRARDAMGLRAVWVGDGDALVAVAREHDLMPTDLGTARIDQHDSSPVFGGGVSINAAGDVGFAAGLTPPDDDQVEWGSGAFIAFADTAEALFSDGFESGDASGWSVATGGP